MNFRRSAGSRRETGMRSAATAIIEGVLNTPKGRAAVKFMAIERFKECNHHDLELFAAELWVASKRNARDLSVALHKIALAELSTCDGESPSCNSN